MGGILAQTMVIIRILEIVSTIKITKVFRTLGHSLKSQAHTWRLSKSRQMSPWSHVAALAITALV